MIIGNWLFSPQKYGENYFFIFNINQAGLINGIIGALKRNAMILISFTWLSSVNSFYDVYEAFAFIKPIRRITIIFLKWLENIKSEFTFFYYSLLIRLKQIQKKNLRIKLIFLKYMLMGSFNRFFFNIGRMTYAGESHSLKKQNEFEIIVLKNVSIKYSLNDEFVLNNIDLQINKGEFIFLKGIDKSGRTTLLKTISGYIPKIEGYITEGTIYINDVEIDNMNLKELANIIRLFNNYTDELFLGLTVSQELLFYTNDLETIKNALSIVKLDDFETRNIDSLSGGEKIRVLFAALIISKPKLVLFDNPISQLDPQSRPIFLRLLAEMKKEGVGIVVVDNEIEQYLDMIDKLIILDNGSITKIIIGEDQLISEVNNKSAISKPLETVQLVQRKEFLINMQGANLTIDKSRILSNINLRINSGELIVILGPNGSGKTSLLFLISGIYVPDSHASLVRGNCKVGMIFQNVKTQVIEETAMKELLITSELLKWEGSKKTEYIGQIKDLIDFDINKKSLNLHPAELLKLTLECMKFDSNLLLLDEPTLEIDRKNSDLLKKDIFNVVEAGGTVIIATHDLNFARNATKYVYLKDGTIQKITSDFSEIINIFDKELDSEV